MTRVPYVRELRPWYLRADLYVHRSLIGETFGATVAEALESGSRIVLAVSPRWDCGPLDFLDQSVHLVGTPGRILQLAGQGRVRCDPPRTRPPEVMPSISAYADALTGFARSSYEGFGRVRPTLWEAWDYLRHVDDEIGSRLGRFAFAGSEFIRQGRRRTKELGRVVSRRRTDVDAPRA